MPEGRGPIEGGTGWRLLRKLLPGWYRERYGRSLLHAHLDRGGGSPAPRRIRFWAYLIWDVVLTSAQARWVGLERDDRGSGGGDHDGKGFAGPDPRDTLRTFRTAARTLLRKPGHTAVAVVTVALGLGVIAAVATVLHAVVLAPPPYEDPDEIVQIVRIREGSETIRLPPADVRTLEEATADLLTVGAGMFQDVAVSGGGPPERVRGIVVTGTTLAMLGVEPALGRLPTESEDVAGGPCRAVLSHQVWQVQFSGSPDALRRAARLDGEPCDVVAVMPEEFAFPGPYWAPGALWLLAGPTGVDWTEEGGRDFFVFGRRKAGVDPAAVVAALDVISARDGEEAPFQVTRWGSSRETSTERLSILLAAAALVLLIACVNVSALQSARALDRRNEVATRLALGASRGQLVRLLAAEAAVLAAVGAAAGMAVAYWSLELIVALRSFYIPRMEEAAFGGFSVAVCLGLATVVAFLMTAAAALGIRRGAVAAVLRRSGRGLTGSRRARRLGGAVVAVETGLALVLVVGAGLLLQSYRDLTALDPGFDPAGVLHVRLTPSVNRYPDAGVRTALYREVEERVSALPDVREAALTYVPPGVGAGPDQAFSIAGRPATPGAWPRTVWRPVSDGYFGVLGIPLLSGGAFEEHRGMPRAAVVNEAFARRFFPEADPVGERLRRGDPGAAEGAEEEAWTIVGVVADVHEEYVYTAPPPAVYVRYQEAPPASVAILARTVGAPLAAAAAIREAVAAVDPDQPIYGVREYSFMLNAEYDLSRLSLTLLSIFAGAALLLAIAGIYGVVSHAVGQRLREMGIRIALGAVGSDVSWLVVRSTTGFALVGGLAGLAALIVLGDVLRALTPGWVGLTPWVLASAVLGVTAAALGAALVPARRAATADPVEALRRE